MRQSGAAGALRELLAAVLLASLAPGWAAPAAAARVPRTCIAEVCEEMPAGSVSMLQMTAGGRSAPERHQEVLPLAADTVAPAAQHQLGAGGRVTGTPSPVPAVQSFRGVQLLLMQLPLSPKMATAAKAPGFFGTVLAPAKGGIQLDQEGLVLVTVAYYPDAQIAWTGLPGESPQQNVPHHLLSIQLPVVHEGKKMYQTSYALVDDDIALITYRMGAGVPAKLANFSFPSAAAVEPADILKVTRRGVEVFKAASFEDGGGASEADAVMLKSILQQPDLTWGTELGNSEPNGLNSVFFERVARARVTSARKVDTALSLAEHEFERIADFFGGLTSVAAWWLQADLEVTTSVLSLPKPKGLMLSPNKDLQQWRLGGAVLTGERGNFFQPLAYKNGDVVWINVKMNKAKVVPYLPPGFTLAGAEGLLWHVRWQPAAVFSMFGVSAPGMNLPLEYNELWVIFPVTHRGRFFHYPVLMVLDDDVAMLAGHDVIGCPKKLGNLTYVFSPGPSEGAEVKLTVDRRGRQFFNLAARLGPLTHKPVPGVNDPNRGDMAWVFSQQFPRNPDLDRPTYNFFTPYEVTHQQRELLDIEVTFGSAAPEPLGEWFAGPALRGGYVRMDQDWGLARGTDLIPFEQPDPAEFAAWWRRVYQVLYI